MSQTRRQFLRNGACALGSMAMVSQLENFGLVHALTPQAATDYKALVCVFLNGGNDGNNMLVSLDQYTQYSSARSASQLALAQASLLPVSPVSGGSYGFHPNMPEMKALFDAGKLAVLCNNGPLVEPLTRTTYQNGTGKKPLQLFSHSDQVGSFQFAGSHPPYFFRSNKATVFKHLDVLQERRQSQTKGFRQLLDRCGAATKPGNHGPPGGIGQCVEYVVE